VSIIPGITITVQIARILHWHRDLPFKARQAPPSTHLRSLTNRKEDPTFPVPAVELRCLQGPVFSQLSPSTLRAIGGPNVSPASTVCARPLRLSFVAYVQDLDAKMDQHMARGEVWYLVSLLTLLCISRPGLVLLQSRRACRGKMGDSYHRDWKHIVPAALAVDALTVSLVGKKMRKFLRISSLIFC